VLQLNDEMNNEKTPPCMRVFIFRQ